MSGGDLTSGARPGRVSSQLAALGVDVLLVHGAANRRYLSGFTGSAGVLVIGVEQQVLVTDFRYTVQAGEQAPAFAVVEASDPLEGLADAVAAAGATRIGFEPEHLTYAGFQKLEARLAELTTPARLVPCADVVEQLRVIKDPAEAAVMREAVEIADQVMARAAAWIQPGVRERELANRLETAMRDLGAEGPAFDTIVAAGPNAAMAHHQPGDHAIAEGEPVIVDLGARLKGYCSDITRTFVAGEADETFQRIYGLVLEAQRAAEAGLRAGMSGRDADALARDPIAAAGHGKDFGHGTGHGVGLEIHEAPRLSVRSDDTLASGMITSVEPGVYLPGWGGVRIEDLVLVQDGGVEILTRSPK